MSAASPASCSTVKLQALANYAAEYGDQFDRIWAVSKTGASMRILDLKSPAVRDAVLASKKPPMELYESGVALEYEGIGRQDQYAGHWLRPGHRDQGNRSSDVACGKAVHGSEDLRFEESDSGMLGATSIGAQAARHSEAVTYFKCQRVVQATRSTAPLSVTMLWYALRATAARAELGGPALTFQTPVTVGEILQGIHHKEYLLPAIQREFVWDADQLRRLVDSLMRHYPIGSFLIWKVSPETASSYAFYDFVTDYHARDHPYASKAIVPAGQGVMAVLDGQQRLTALNIAVYGSLAVKKKYAWWSSTDAFPRKRLYLNLLADADPDELGLRYDLRFLTDEEAKTTQGQPDAWYPLAQVMTVANPGPAMFAEVARRGITNTAQAATAYQRLYDLFEAFRTARPINYYLETDQDADKVLDIFVRVNSGGTTLSYSDLLLSMATNQWQHLDAREEVRALVQRLNTGGPREFNFSKDMVLKAALLIANVDVRFRVSNFTQDNMKKVEAVWDQIRDSLLRAATLTDMFGFSSRTLTADSVVVLLAYYLHRRNLSDRYLHSTADAADRRTIQYWVIRSLIKRGVWGSGLDTVLTRLRRVVDEHGQHGFPADMLKRDMASLGKSLAFDPTEIDELLEMRYGGQRTFSVLSLLYPGLDLTKEFHEDHIFPRSRFTAKRLADAGVPHDQIEKYRTAVDCLPNLQLLGGVPNIEKQASLPAEWLATAFPSDEQRATYLRENDLDGLPLDLADFLNFYNQRKEGMRQRLLKMLGVNEVAGSPVSDPVSTSSSAAGDSGG